MCAVAGDWHRRRRKEDPLRAHPRRPPNRTTSAPKSAQDLWLAGRPGSGRWSSRGPRNRAKGSAAGGGRPRRYSLGTGPGRLSTPPGLFCETYPLDGRIESCHLDPKLRDDACPLRKSGRRVVVKAFCLGVVHTSPSAGNRARIQKQWEARSAVNRSRSPAPSGNPPGEVVAGGRTRITSDTGLMDPWLCHLSYDAL